MQGCQSPNRRTPCSQVLHPPRGRKAALQGTNPPVFKDSPKSCSAQRCFSLDGEYTSAGTRDVSSVCQTEQATGSEISFPRAVFQHQHKVDRLSPAKEPAITPHVSPYRTRWGREGRRGSHLDSSFEGDFPKQGDFLQVIDLSCLVSILTAKSTHRLQLSGEFLLKGIPPLWCI